jgi:predicted nucleotidyltransferase component of viral defense system
MRLYQQKPCCYSLTELFGEKLRALAERCRPRDLYDVVHMHRHPDLIGMNQAENTVLVRKCSRAEIDVPTIETRLGHQLPPAAATLRQLLVDPRRCFRLARRHPAHR